MSITLYYDRYTRAERVRWLLEELEVPHELARVSLSKDENKAAEFLKVHPLGKLPALRIDDEVMIESAAICIYLADRFGDGRLAVPVDSPHRAAYLQWIVFATASLEPGLTEYYYHTAGWAEDRRIAAMADHGREQFELAAQVVADHVADREYMVDDRFTAADVVVGAVLGMARGLNMLPANLRDYGKRVGSRPAARKSRAD